MYIENVYTITITAHATRPSQKKHIHLYTGSVNVVDITESSLNEVEVSSMNECGYEWDMGPGVNSPE